MRRSTSSTKLNFGTMSTLSSSPRFSDLKTVKTLRTGSKDTSSSSILPLTEARGGQRSSTSAFGMVRYTKSRDFTSVNSEHVASSNKLQRLSRQPTDVSLSARDDCKILGNSNKDSASSRLSQTPRNLESQEPKIISSKIFKDVNSPERRSIPDCPITGPVKRSLGDTPFSFNKSRPGAGPVYCSPFNLVCPPTSPHVLERETIARDHKYHLDRSPTTIPSSVEQKSKITLVRTSISASIKSLQSIRARLQDCLGDLNSKSVFTYRPAASGSPKVREAGCAVLEVSELTRMSTDAITESLQQPQLKDILQNPQSVGTQFTVAQFRRLESSSLNETRKSCLKASSLSRQVSMKEDSIDTSDNLQQVLKRKVSFSENVVMFMYQA